MYLISSVITALLSNFLIQQREKEKERRDFFESILKPSENYLIELHSVILRISSFIKFPVTFNEELRALLYKLIEQMSKVTTLRRLEILEDRPINILVEELQEKFHTLSIDTLAFVDSINVDAKNDDKNKLDVVSILTSITLLLRYLDFFRLNHYKPTDADKGIQRIPNALKGGKILTFIRFLFRKA